MSDILIRDIPDEVLQGIDSRAARLGISRSEYVRRRLAQDAASGTDPVSVEQLQAFADRFADLDNSQIMGDAWR